MKYTVRNQLHGKVIVQTTSETIALQSVLLNKNCVLYIDNQKKSKSFPQISLSAVHGQLEFGVYENIYSILYSTLVSHDELNLFHHTTIIGHGSAHAQRVGIIASIICLEEHVEIDTTILIILGAIIHDVGRNQSNLFNDKHGEESVRMVKLALEERASSGTKPMNQFLHMAGLDCSASDEMITALFAAISVHCKSATEWDLMQDSLPNKVQSEFRRMANIIEDADALDRVRFANNLEINYLRLNMSKCLIYSAGQLLNQAGEIDNDSQN